MDAVLDQICPNRVCRRGFSYLDVMIAIVIVGVAVAALMQSMTTTTDVTATARQVTVGVNLTRHVHEYAMTLSMTKLDALNNQTFTTPIGSDGNGLIGPDGQVLPAYAGWQQVVSVSQAPATSIQSTGASEIRRIVVEARYKGAVVHRESWLLAPVGL